MTAGFIALQTVTIGYGVGGTANPASGWYKSSTVVSVSSTPDLTHYFSGFSGDLSGTVSPQDLTVNSQKSITANFTPTPSTVVDTLPSGLQVTVDSVLYTAPRTFQWVPGTTHTLSALPQAGTPGTQYAMPAWAPGGAASQTITASSAPAAYTANFSTQYFLTTVASPPTGGTVNPASGWYNAGAVLQVTATASPSYQFVSFSGALNGVATPQNLTMTAPASINASFNALPADFTVSVTPVSSTTFAGSTATYRVVTTLMNGFSAPITFAVSGHPVTPTPTFQSDGAGATLMTIATATAENAGPSGQYSLTVTATGGGVVKQAVPVPLTIQDFKLIFSPSTAYSGCNPTNVQYRLSVVWSGGTDVVPVNVAFSNITSGFLGTGNQISVQNAYVDGSPATESSPADLYLLTAPRGPGCNGAPATVEVSGAVPGGPYHRFTAYLMSNVPSPDTPPGLELRASPASPSAQTVTPPASATFGVSSESHLQLLWRCNVVCP